MSSTFTTNCKCHTHASSHEIRSCRHSTHPAQCFLSLRYECEAGSTSCITRVFTTPVSRVFTTPVSSFAKSRLHQSQPHKTKMVKNPATHGHSRIITHAETSISHTIRPGQLGSSYKQGCIVTISSSQKSPPHTPTYIRRISIAACGPMPQHKFLSRDADPQLPSSFQ